MQVPRAAGEWARMVGECSCAGVLDDLEWKVLWVTRHRRSPPAVAPSFVSEQFLGKTKRKKMCIKRQPARGEEVKRFRLHIRSKFSLSPCGRGLG